MMSRRNLRFLTSSVQLFCVTAGVALLSTSAQAQNQVTQLWVASYDGPVNGADRPYALTVDHNGNVYVTGESQGIGTGWDYATVKYEHNGNQLWEARYNGPENGTDQARAVAVDTNGNVYVTGLSEGGSTGLDILTVKYDSTGSQIWTARYNYFQSTSDKGSDLDVDDSGNVYVVGSSFQHLIIIKYDSTGSQVWVADYPATAGLLNEMVLDATGNIHATGVANNNYITLKYNPSGGQLAARIYNGPQNGSYYDQAKAIVVDANANVYVTGGSDSPDGMVDYATLKYSTTQAWLRRYDSPVNQVDEGEAIGVDQQGNVYVTGRSWGAVAGSSTYDYVTIKYDSVGNMRCLAYHQGGEPSDLVLDTAGYIYVAGTAPVIKYDSHCKQLWMAPSGGGARDLFVDAEGNVYVTGGSSNYVTTKFSQAPLFTRGDVNCDSTYGLSDALYILIDLFGGGPSPCCVRAGDADDSGSYELGDALYILIDLFGGGPEPPAPFPGCGTDPIDDPLTCDSFSPCGP